MNSNLNRITPAHKIILALAILLTALGGMSAVRAASLTWDPAISGGAGLGGSGTWNLNSTANWWTGAADVAWSDNSAKGTNAAVFSGAAAGTVTLNTSLSVSNLQFTTTGYTLSGAGTLTLGAGGINAGTLTSGTTTIGNALSLSGGQQLWQIGSGGTLAINGAVSRIAGSGVTVDFSTSGVTSTTLTMNNGIIGGWATMGNSIPSTNTGDFISVSNGILVKCTNYLAVSGAGTSTPNTNTLINQNLVSGILNGANAITHITNSVTINSLITQGDFDVTNNSTLTIGSGGFIFRGPSRWILQNNGGNQGTGNGINSGLASGELFLHSPNTNQTDWRVWPQVKDNGATPTIVVKDGPGVVILQNINNAFTGGTIINNGVLAPGKALATLNSTNLGFGPVTVNSGGILQVGYASGAANSDNYYSNTLVIQGGKVLADDGHQHLIGSITISNLGATFGESYDGGASASTGNKALFVDGVLGGSGPITLQQAADAGESRVNGNEGGNAFNSSVVCFSNNANTYSGTLSVIPYTTGSGAGSYLALNSGAALQFATVSPTNNGSAQRFNSQNTSVIFGTGNSAYTLGGLTGTGGIILSNWNENTYVSSGTIALSVGNNNASTTYSGPLIGNGSFNKIGTGSLTLSGASTYTGATTIRGGTLQMNSANGTSASVTVTNGATLALNVADALGFAAGKNVPTIFSGSTISNITSASRVTLWNGLTMTGGTLTGTSTGDANGAYSLSGIVTATSDASGNAATISGGPISLQNQNVANGTITFNVARGSAAPASDLNLSANLIAFSTTAGNGLAKTNNGILTLTGTNTYTGSTIVQAGTLILGALASISNSAAIVVSNAAVFDVSQVTGGWVQNAGQALGGNGVVTGSVVAVSGAKISPGASAGTLSYSNNLTLNGGVTNLFDLSNVTTVGGGVNDLIQVGGSFTASGVNTILINPIVGNLASGTYTLIKYGTAHGSSLAANFTVGFVTAPPRVLVNVVDNLGAQEIDVVVTANPSALVWQGTNTSTWDATLTTNWLNGATSDVFFTGDNVVFDNTSTNPIVNLTGTLVPGSVTVNGTTNYTFGSSGKISGGTSLIVNNTGTLTVLTANDYSGGTSNGLGTLQVGNGTASGALGSGNIANNGALVYNHTDAVTLAQVVSGSGSLTQQGSGSLALNGANIYTGGTVINGGTVIVTNDTGLGAGGAALTFNGGTLQAANTNTMNNRTVTLNSGGGTINTLTSASLQVSNLVTGAGALTKSGAGLLIVNGANDFSGGTLISAGTLQLGAGAGGTVGTGAVTNNATFQVGRSDDFAFANPVTGSGVFVKSPTSTGKMTLQSTNQYLATGAGVAQVNGGTLQIDPTGLLISSGEFWAGQNVSTGACIINGGTLIVSNWIAVGRNSASALGSMTLNSGSVQKYGAGNIILGSLGANGTLTVNGGSLYCNTALNLGENAGGQGYFNLNGGTVQANSVGTQSGTTSVARFNSGTLQALTNNYGFVSGLSQALVQSGGAVIDDSGFTIGVNQSLLNDVTSPGGGLTKKGSGTMILSGSSTYTGNTLVNNGTLQLNQDAVLHLTFDQSNGSIVTNLGTGGPTMNGYLIGGGVSIVSGGRFGKALSINGTGGGSFTNIVVISNNVVGNINGSGGNWTVGMWVNTTTPGAEYLFNGTTAYTWSSLETIFYLTSASSTAGTNAGMVRFGGGFNRGTAGVSNGAWHFVVVSDNNGTITQYVDGAADAWSVNGITAAATGGLWVIGGSPDTGDGTAHFNGLIDEVYMFNRSLSLAEVQTLYNNNNNLNPVLPASTPVTLVANTSVLNLNDVSQTIGSLTGAAGSSVVIGQNDTLTIGNDNTSTTYPGIISGAGGVGKVGSGTLTLTGANTYSANTFVHSGALVLDTGGVVSNTAFSSIGQLTGDNATLTVKGSAAYSTASDLNAGDIGNSIGTINISDTANVTANALYAGSANAAASSANGTINQTNGTITTLSSSDGVFVLGGRNAGSALGTGTYNLVGGTLNVNNGGNTWIGGYGTGTLNASGGTANLSGFVSVGRYAGGVGSLNISSGSVVQNNNTRFLIIGENGTGTLTVSSNGQLNVNSGAQLALGWSAGGLGTANLNGGSISTPKIVQGSGSGTFNFNGGTLLANAASAAFMTGLTAANIQAGGAIINDGGFAITIGQALLDGGGSLTKLGTGTLALANNNTYTGNTVVSNGTLALTGIGSISNSPNLVISGGTTLDVSGETSTFALGAGQTLTSPSATANVVGNVNLNSGSLVVTYTNGTPSLASANGMFTLNNNSVTVTVLGNALPVGAYKLVSTNSGGTVSGTVSSSPLTVAGAGIQAGTVAGLQIVNGELYLVIHQPVANPNIYSRNGLFAWRIAVSDLLTNATDAAGDALTLSSLSTTTQGINLVIRDGIVQYFNTNLVSDQFTYTVSDGRGGVGSGVITLTVGSIAGVGGQISNFAANNGSVNMTFAGIPGYLYHVQVSTNLTDWNNVWTTNAPALGTFDFSDSNAPQPTAFYRLMWNGN